jgi:peptide/nickel transport system permease protein
MRQYILKRLLLILPTLLGITLVTFVIIQLAPGNPATLKIQMTRQGGVTDQAVAQAIVEQTRKLYGLDKPLLVRYGIWLKQIATLNFGNSYKDHRPVMEKIWEAMPITLQISLLSIFLSYLIAIPMGVYSAVKQDSAVDRVSTVALFVLYSLPNFWVATLLIVYLGGGDYLDLFPIDGANSFDADPWPFWRWLSDRIWHLVLPVACLTYGGLASLSRYMRAGMIEVIRQDYILTARAKGLSEKIVVFKHAFRNSVIPIVTFLAFLLPAMIGGSVIVESIFSIPGMGKLGFEAVLSRDYPVIMAIATISALLTLVGILLSDILYVLVDPRISFEGL